MSETLFISDSHLDALRPDITQHFVEFIKTRAAKARVLYILGDLFEVWLGDDDPAENLSPIFDALHNLSKHTKIFFMAGNRDFLVGDQLAKKLNFEILKEPTFITLNQQKTALLHGDSLCTDDVDYQKFKALVRSKNWQQDFLAKPLSERQHIALQLRKDSQKATQNKQIGITDVNSKSVLHYFKSHNVSQIIHGHTHRPAVHITNHLTRFVLGDWQPNASYLQWNGMSLTLHDKRTC
jgi:UDP-2,3-diacylglucosamine hydrolase